MKVEIVEGNLLEQDVEVIVNSWNRNIIPWWMLILQGVSAAIKKQAGTQPFRQVSRMGSIPLGEARETGSGKLAFKAIIHVAGINMLWIASEYSVSNSVINAIEIVNQRGYSSVAFPLIGSGSGVRGKEWSEQIITQTLDTLTSEAKVVIVKYPR